MNQHHAAIGVIAHSGRVTTLRVRHYSHVTESFPRLQARTRRFTLGAPSDLTISPDGQRVAFLQSTGPTDPVKRLMVADVTADFRPEVAADPASILAGDEQLSVAERARRERLRESGSGIVGYSTDDALSVAAFALSGAIGVVQLTSGSGGRNAQLLELTGPAIDPQVDPTGQRLAWVADRCLYVAEIDGSGQRCLLTPDNETRTWGLANFLAAEEFDRVRGFWWAPDGSALLVEDFDDAPVDEWTISDPTDPTVPARSIRYPAVGRPNPSVRLWLVGLDGQRREVGWERDRWEYLVSVRWNAFGPALVTLFDRLQRNGVVLSVNASDASTHEIERFSDPAWVSVLPGTPTWDSLGRLVTTHQTSETETIAVDGTPVKLPSGTQAAAVVRSTGDGLLLSVQARATASSLLFIDPAGQQHSPTRAEGWNSGTYRGGTLYTVSASLTSPEWRRELWHWRPGVPAPLRLTAFRSLAMQPPIDIRPQLLAVGERNLNAVVLWPQDHQPGSRRLPVIMNPYGGPHAQRVIEVSRTFAEAQWIANQGFAVIVADGRGSPGRGPAWERTINGDLGSLPLQDQVDALRGVAHQFPRDIDLTRVGITGWSFGGYLAALAALRRPDVFHAAVAGAPVTEWRLYDSAYTERYLGDGVADAANYEASSLLPLAAGLERPLMIIHGFADDNVVVAHSLKLSSELTAAGRPHTFVPLANVTHMTPQEEVAENLLKLEVGFFQRELVSRRP